MTTIRLESSNNNISLLNRIANDEGFSPTPYFDRTQYTYGFGCKAPTKTSRITLEAAKPVLVTRVNQSIEEFSRVFKGHLHKFNEVRRECFINMLFNLGEDGLRKFKNTLLRITAVDKPDWFVVAKHLRASLWYKQVGPRAVRISKEVETGVVLPCKLKKFF